MRYDNLINRLNRNLEKVEDTKAYMNEICSPDLVRKMDTILNKLEKLTNEVKDKNR